MKALRKLVINIMTLLFCVTVLVGCNKSQVDSPAATPTVNNPGSNVIKQGKIQKSGNVILKELAFVYNDNTVAISDIVDDEKLESILGKAEENKSHTYSLDDGLNMDPLIGFTEKQYKFPGNEIKTINATEDKKFFVFSIKITDSKYSTVRNIKVGDSVKKLKEVYPEGNLIGNGAANEEDDFLYLPANYVDGMQFHIKNEMIESIMMYTLLD